MGAPVVTTLATHQLFDQTNGPLSQQFAAINASSSGANTIVAAAPGKKIKVIDYLIIAGGTVTVTWESSGGTLLSGALPLVANSGASPSFNPLGKLQTLTGEGLVLYLSGAVSVTGHLTYVQV